MNKKGVFSLLVAIILVISNNMSSSIAKQYENTLDYTTVIGINSNVWSEVFGLEEEASNTNIVYNLIKKNIDIDDDGEEDKYIEIDGELYIDKEKYSFTASGKYSDTALESGTEMISCPLMGAIIIDKIEYDLIIGYDEVAGDEAITMSITKDNAIYVLAFGTGVIDEEISSNFVFEESEDAISTSEVGYDFIDSKKVDLEYYDASFPCALARIHVDENETVLMLSTKTFLEDMYEEMYDLNPYFIGVTLYEVTFGLNLTEGRCVGTSPATGIQLTGNETILPRRIVLVGPQPSITIRDLAGMNIDNDYLKVIFAVHTAFDKTYVEGNYYVDYIYKVYETKPISTYSYYIDASTRTDEGLIDFSFEWQW